MAKPIKITITGDDKGFQKAMGRVDKSMGGLTRNLGKVAGAVAGAFAAREIVSFGKDAVTLASDLSEAADAASTIFGEGFGQLEDTLADSAVTMGMNQAAALELANGYGVLFKELSDTERATVSLDAAARAADVGSMFNAAPAEVAQAFTAAINGSSETVRRFGIDTSDAAIKQYALANGIEGVDGKLSESQKKFIRHQIIMRDSSIAAGNFADTSDGLANQQRILQARFEELQIKLGQKLLPVVVKVAGFLLDEFLPAAERLGTYLAETFGPTFTAIAGFIRDDLIPMFKGATGTMDGEVSPVVKALRDLFNNGLKPAFQAVAEFVRDDIIPILQRLYVIFDERIRPVIENVIIPVLAKFYEIVFGKVMPVLLELVGVVLEQVVTAIETFFDALDTLIGWVDSAIDGFNRLVDTIKDLPGKVRDAARGLWDGIPRPPSFITDGVGSVFSSIPGFASGIASYSGGVAMVGERGPELVSLPRGSRVTPHHELDRASVGGVTVNVASQADPWQIGHEVAWAIRTGGV